MSVRSGPARWSRRRASTLLAAASFAALALSPAAADASTTPGFDPAKPVEIVNGHTGLRADVWEASTAENQGLVLWGNNDSASQEFDLLPAGNGYYVVKARHSGQCLTLDQQAPSWGNGTRVVQNPYCGTDWTASQWRLRVVSDGVSCSGDTCSTSSAIGNTLVNRYTGRCLDAEAPSGSPATRATLQQWDCIPDLDAWNVANQIFNFKNV